MKSLINGLMKHSASDLHIKVGRPPLFRINGKLVAARVPPFSREKVNELIKSILPDGRWTELTVKKQIDFSFEFLGIGRFRCNVFYQKGELSAAIRVISKTVPSLDDLGVPKIVKELCQRPRGLVLITGATGCGKSTTLTAMIQYLNEMYPIHILTLEDPIEFIYEDQKACITQREVGSDVISMNDGLIAGLRQDPDVIMLGELREVDTIQAALTAAETGHLVLSTLHTTDAKNTIDRILDVFPPDAQNQIRTQLASTLLGVVCQHLVPRTDGNGQALVCEIMIKSPAIEGYIRKNELVRISEAIETSNSYYQMQTLNQALEKLVINRTISLSEALKASNNPDDLKLKLSGVDREEGYRAS